MRQTHSETRDGRVVVELRDGSLLRVKNANIEMVNTRKEVSYLLQMVYAETRPFVQSVLLTIWAQ
jgi:hypothetical protein